MLISDAARGPLMLVIPILHHYGKLSFPALLATAFAIGIFAAPYYASSRLIVPEVAGEDEQAVASVNAVLSGANQITQLAGPVSRGRDHRPRHTRDRPCRRRLHVRLLVPDHRDGRSGGARVEAAAEQKGVLAGLKFLMNDSLLGPVMIAACVLNFVAQGIVLGVQAVDIFRYDGKRLRPGVPLRGLRYRRVLGSIVAQQLTQKVPLLKLAAAAIVLMPLPLFLLSPTTPWPVAMVSVAGFAFFAPLVNAPVFGILTVRTPAELGRRS